MYFKVFENKVANKFYMMRYDPMDLTFKVMNEEHKPKEFTELELYNLLNKLYQGDNCGKEKR